MTAFFSRLPFAQRVVLPARRVRTNAGDVSSVGARHAVPERGNSAHVPRAIVGTAWSCFSYRQRPAGAVEFALLLVAQALLFTLRTEGPVRFRTTNALNTHPRRNRTPYTQRDWLFRGPPKPHFCPTPI